MKSHRGEEVQFHSILTSALDADEWSMSGRGRGYFNCGTNTTLLTDQEAGWASEPVWAFWRRENY
jgi:hypothetical protein